MCTPSSHFLFALNLTENQHSLYGLVWHLADLVEGVLPISSGVFEVVMSRERPVDVPGDCTVLGRLL